MLVMDPNVEGINVNGAKKEEGLGKIDVMRSRRLPPSSPIPMPPPLLLLLGNILDDKKIVHTKPQTFPKSGW
jgi:hypothetical protein